MRLVVTSYRKGAYVAWYVALTGTAAFRVAAIIGFGVTGSARAATASDKDSRDTSAKNFREGESYFTLSFLDRAMTRPVVETLIFIGMNLSDEDAAPTWYFQDARSYNAGGPAHESTKRNDAEVYCYTQSDVDRLNDVNGLIDELKKLPGRA